MITVKQFYLNDLRECCYVLSDQTGECVIVDPGISSRSEENRIGKYISDNNLRPVKLLCTHGHFDHVMGNSLVSSTYGIKTYIHPEDKDLLKVAKSTCRLFDIDVQDPPMETVDINDGDTVTFGNSSLKVISTPGHTWGSVVFYSPEDKVCVTGDTVFAGNCGRTDLPEGSNEAMYKSLVEKLPKMIAPDAEIFPGHGPASTMAEELEHNPYLRAETWHRYNIGNN